MIAKTITVIIHHIKIDSALTGKNHENLGGSEREIYCEYSFAIVLAFNNVQYRIYLWEIQGHSKIFPYLLTITNIAVTLFALIPMTTYHFFKNSHWRFLY